MLPTSRNDVIRLLKGIEPEAVRKHGVVVGSQTYPVKQAYSIVSGDDRLDFNTVKARRYFISLGFEVHRFG